jgi:L-iditol 2-dehydrogenase
MNAQILHNIGDIRYEHKDTPVPGQGEALVKVTRCGICGSDIPRVYRTGAHNMPLIPGHEMCGVVEKCEERPELAGKRVGIFPLLPCRKCPQCLSGHYEMCEDYDYLGSRSDGGFAEYVCVPVWNLIPIPDEIEDDEAAMLEPMCVAIHAIRGIGLIDRIEAGDGSKQWISSELSLSDPEKEPSVVVCGLGTIGLFVAMFLRDAGYRKVFCIGNKDIQKQKLLELRFDEADFCDVRHIDPEKFVMEKTDDRGADYYFECIGRPESYAQAVALTGPLGKIMLVGNPAGDMPLTREVYWKILRRQICLKGTWNSSFPEDWTYALERLVKWNEERRAGKPAAEPSSLITHRFSLMEMAKGLELMRDKSEEYVKVICELS